MLASRVIKEYEQKTQHMMCLKGLSLSAIQDLKP